MKRNRRHQHLSLSRSLTIATVLVVATQLTPAIVQAYGQAAWPAIGVNYERQFPHVFKRHGPPVQKIALTFDDGPDLVYTPKILDTLRKEGVHATFFVLGVNAAKHPGMIRRIVQEGHALGNHSFDHRNLIKSTQAKIKWEIRATDQVLVRISGQSPRWFRAPYGNINPLVLNELNQLGYRAVNWSVDSDDWRSLSARQVKQNILRNVKPGAIILQHCAAGSEKEDLSGTVRALPDIIHTLKRRGYRFVTIPQLFAPDSSTVHARPSYH